MDRKNTVAKVGKHVATFTGDGQRQLLTVEETADFLRCSISILNKWRVAGAGPPFVRIGTRVRYRLSDLTAFIKTRTRTSTSEAPAA